LSVPNNGDSVEKGAQSDKQSTIIEKTDVLYDNENIKKNAADLFRDRRRT
jgi:hypothetical protein